MYKKFKSILMVACLCILPMSCTSRGYMQLPGQEKLAATQASEVAIYVTDDTGSAYTTLGAVVVSSDAGNNATATVARLKTEAAKLGANAIVNMKLRYSHGFWGLSLEARGTAVKLNP